MSVITLGSLTFNGPFLAPLWSPPKTSGLYAVMVPGWRLNTFRAIYFGQAESLGADLIKSHERHTEWVTIAGTDWNLYIATHEMSFATPAQLESTARELARSYKPEFKPVDDQAPSLRTLLLAQAMRNGQDK
ncbi:MAG TPA: hypothetical protein VEU32_16210 [Burkholderiales bacterium]|nr:hypothetical protein [Burkholderiales bacterium]